MEYDFFLSYSRNINLMILDELVEQLSFYGIKVWYDRKEVVLGSNIYTDFTLLLKQIPNWKGAIIFFDQTYLQKKWCQEELHAILSGKLHFLPILYGITKDEIGAFNHELLNYNYHTYRNDNEQIVNKILLFFIQTILPIKKYTVEKDKLLRILYDDYCFSDQNSLVKVIKADSLLTCLQIKHKPTKKIIVLHKIISNIAKNCISQGKCSFDDIHICDYIVESIFRRN